MSEGEEEVESVSGFVERVRGMMKQDSYAIPYSFAQRDIRSENYQMASQALLEDMFYDAFGAFLMRTDPSSEFARREGSEPWDYRLRGLGLSHKEAQTPMFTLLWQPGDGPGNKTPKWPTASFPHPVVFVFTPLSPRARAEVSIASLAGPVAVPVELTGLTYKSAQSAKDGSVVVMSKRVANGLIVERAWTLTEWNALTIHDVLALTRDALLEREFWISKPTAGQAKQGLNWMSAVEHQTLLRLADAGLQPGIYVFTRDQVTELPLESNNKAHFVPKATVETLMRAARAEERYVPLPMWPALFAPPRTPNLYHTYKERFDSIFDARRRD